MQGGIRTEAPKTRCNWDSARGATRTIFRPGAEAAAAIDVVRASGFESGGILEEVASAAAVPQPVIAKGVEAGALEGNGSGAILGDRPPDVQISADERSSTPVRGAPWLTGADLDQSFGDPGRIRQGTIEDRLAEP